MDPITHGLTGAALTLFYKNKTGQGEQGQKLDTDVKTVPRFVLITTVIAATIPDIDFIFRLGGDFAYFKYHRGPTHSIPGIFLLAILLTLVLARVYPARKKSTLFSWALLGLVSHISLDLLNTYSTYVLWPFTPYPVSTDILMIIDPVLWGIFFTGLILGRFGKLREARREIGLAVFLVLTLYLGTRVYIHQDLKQAVAMNFKSQSPARIAIIPGMFGVNSWNYIVDSPQEYILGTVSFPNRAIKINQRLPKETIGPTEKAALATDIGQTLNYFAPYLYLKTTKQGDNYLVHMSDLRYNYRGFTLGASFVVNKNNQVIDTIFRPI